MPKSKKVKKKKDKEPIAKRTRLHDKLKSRLLAEDDLSVQIVSSKPQESFEGIIRAEEFKKVTKRMEKWDEDDRQDKIITHRVGTASNNLINLINDLFTTSKAVTPNMNINGFYDYRKWKPEWEKNSSSTDSIIKFLFNPANGMDTDFCRKRYRVILDKTYDKFENDRLLAKKFFKLLMSLPLFEYEYTSNKVSDLKNLKAYKKPSNPSKYGRKIGKFMYHLQEIDEENYKSKINHILKIFNIVSLKKFMVDIVETIHFDEKRELFFQMTAETNFIKPIELFLNECLGIDYTLGPELRKPSSEPLDPNDVKSVDTAIFFEHTRKVGCCYEFKTFPIMPEFYGPDGTFRSDLLFGVESESGNDNVLMKFIKQLELEMMSHRIDRGVLSDSYTFIFIIIDLERFHTDIRPNILLGADLSPRGIPINYKIKSIHSGRLTVREFMLGFMYDCYRDKRELDRIREEMVVFEKYYQLAKPSSNVPKMMTKPSDSEDSEKEPNVTSQSKKNDLNMMYNMDCDRLLRMSQLVAREAESRNLSSLQELDKSFDTSSLFSGSPCSTVPSSRDGTLFEGKESTVQNYHISRVQADYIFEMMKHGFGVLKTIDLERDEVEIIHEGGNYLSEVFVIDAKHICDCLRKRVESDKVVLKINNPLDVYIDYDLAYESNNIVCCDMNGVHDEEKLRYAACLKNYITEVECYMMLRRNKNFNSIFYDHKDVFVTLLIDGFNNSIGFTNIFKYLPSEELPMDMETYKKAAEQLDIIHETGIIHGDIAERNILYSNGMVYIIDYARAIYCPSSKYRKEIDRNDLKDVFGIKDSD